MRRLDVSDTIHLSEFSLSDKAALLEHLADAEVTRNLLRVPHPYTEADADFWLTMQAERRQRLGRQLAWAIRNQDGHLIGAVGFRDFEVGADHATEVGYWLAKPWWGQGIMARVLDAVCRHGFEELDLERIAAGVFAGNDQSCRALEKCGFQFEGVLQRLYRKDGQLLDARMYARLKP
jgi:RimJ/RimL family protein N-acetyltransferase